MSPEGATFVISPPKTGEKLRHLRPLQSLKDSKKTEIHDIHIVEKVYGKTFYATRQEYSGTNSRSCQLRIDYFIEDE